MRVKENQSKRGPLLPPGTLERKEEDKKETERRRRANKRSSVKLLVVKGAQG